MEAYSVSEMEVALDNIRIFATADVPLADILKLPDPDILKWSENSVRKLGKSALHYSNY